MRKAKKDIVDLTTFTFMGAGGSLALAGIGGTVALHGQQGISNVARFAPAIGSMAGAGMVMRQVGGMDRQWRKRKKYR